MSPVTQTCTSGRKIPGVVEKDDPCGQPLVTLKYRTASGEKRMCAVCPKCDRWPDQRLVTA